MSSEAKTVFCFKKEETAPLFIFFQRAFAEVAVLASGCALGCYLVVAFLQPAFWGTISYCLLLSDDPPFPYIKQQMLGLELFSIKQRYRPGK
jgi:hypothetical protein